MAPSNYRLTLKTTWIFSNLSNSCKKYFGTLLITIHRVGFKVCDVRLII